MLLFCAADLTRAGGSCIRARLIADGLSGLGAAVFVLAGGIPPELAARGIEGEALGGDRPPERAIAEAAARFRPDVLLGVTEGSADAVLSAGRSIGVPVVFDLHGLGFVEVLELGRGFGDRIPRLRNSLRWILAMRRADAVTVANPGLLPVLRRLNPNTFPLFGMTDLALFSPSPPQGGNECHVLYAGNFLPWQGVGLLVEAIRLLKGRGAPVRFTLQGDPGGCPEVASWRREFPGPGVRFLPPTDYREMPAAMADADVVVVPRRFMLSTYLAFPQKIPDAMAAGRTIVATGLMPHRWALADPPAGILCPPTAEGLAGGILEAADPALRARLGACARGIAETRFGHVRQAERLLEIMEGARRARR